MDMASEMDERNVGTYDEYQRTCAENERLRAEVEDMRQQRDYWQESAVEMRRYKEASESLLAGLRGALEEIDEALCVTKAHDIGDAVVKAFSIINSALALTPASAGNRIKAEALDGAWKSIAALETVPAEDLRDRHINEGIRQALDVVFEFRQMCYDAAEAAKEAANAE